MMALFLKVDIINRMFVALMIKLAKLMLVMPAKNAVSEGSFLSLKRIKTYFLLAATNNRLKYLLILHIHNMLTDRLGQKLLTSLLKEEKEDSGF